MVFDKKTLVFPDETRFEEHTILTNGDFIISDRVSLQFGISTNGRVFAGERVKMNGNVTAGGDVRVDMFSTIRGDVDAEGNVYLGEGTRIGGKLSLRGDLDVGDDVQIEKGFEAKGWINIRNPIPFVIYIFLYLLELLRLGQSDEVQRILDEMDTMENEEDAAIAVSDVFTFVPADTTIGLQESIVHGNMRIGSGCRILGNYNVKGSVYVGKGSRIYGALRSSDEMVINDEVEIQGSVGAGGEIRLGAGCKILGNLSGKSIQMFQNAMVEGTINAEEGIRFCTEKSEEMKEKVERFENDVAMVEDVMDLLG
ncbi:MAG: acyltransferase [Thermoplasmata archaeon HGW-Thermoplasmata-1]|nr:MAG: acyltransferase [Thermoplasmata archaeon HGW-Thermoplasmata-1]